MADVVYVVTERSPVGETVLGVFSSIAAARQIVPSGSDSRLEDVRIQGLALDVPPDPRTPWRVVVTRDGSVEVAEAAVT